MAQWHPASSAIATNLLCAFALRPHFLQSNNTSGLFAGLGRSASGVDTGCSVELALELRRLAAPRHAFNVFPADFCSITAHPASTLILACGDSSIKRASPCEGLGCSSQLVTEAGFAVSLTAATFLLVPSRWCRRWCCSWASRRRQRLVDWRWCWCRCQCCHR